MINIMLMIVAAKAAVAGALYVVCDGRRSWMVMVAFALAWAAWLGLCVCVIVEACMHDDGKMLMRGLIAGVPSLFVTYLWWDRNYGSRY